MYLFIEDSTRYQVQEKPSSRAVDYIIVCAFVGVIFIIIVLIGCCIMFKSNSTPSTPSTSNTAFVRVPTKEIKIDDVNIFQTGVWSSRYLQYGSWHESHELLLSYDPKSFTVNGHGSDEVGGYTIIGKYSMQTNEIELTKTYQPGTGNLAENLEHIAKIEVTWNPTERQFVGKYYVDTSKFFGEDIFQLKFEKPLKPLMNEKNDNV
jgi:hypothetical protein